MGQVFQELGSDPECRAVVLSGNGKMFTSGIDFSALMEIGQVIQSEDLDVSRKAKVLYDFVKQAQQPFTDIEDVRNSWACYSKTIMS